MAENNIRRKAEEIHDLSEHDDAGNPVDVDHNENHVSRHQQPSPPTSRQRATSCDSMLSVGRRGQPHTCFSPLESWDDTCLINRHHVAPLSHLDGTVPIHQPAVASTSRAENSASTQKPQIAPTSRSPFSTLIDKLHVTPVSNFEEFLAAIRDNQHDTTFQGPAFRREDHRLQAGQGRMDRGQKDKIETGVIVRRTNNINVFDHSNIDPQQSSEPTSPAGNNSEGEGRFLNPGEYFQELDDLGSRVFQKSIFHFYIDGTVNTPFDGSIRFRAPFIENALFQTCSHDAVLMFCTEIVRNANENTVDGGVSGAGGHYTNHQMHHRAIEDWTHLVECRNIISAVWENLQQMRFAHYCEDFISLLVLDRTRASVAKLMRIECSRIEELTVAFETCLFKVMSEDPAMVLLNNVSAMSNDLTTACLELLLKLDIKVEGADDRKDIWQCAVHVLDMAVISYVGAHTQFLGSPEVASVTLPGPFQEQQRYRFRRRSFSCIGEFLGGQQAWVLEIISTNTLPGNPPRLSLLTDAETFGDIWGPMWESHVLGDEERIVQYSVGNGVILPWNLPSPNVLEVQKDEVFCHWMSDKDRRDNNISPNSSSLRSNDILLIGAPVTMACNDQCKSSFTHQKQTLRNSGALSEPRTIENEMKLSSKLVRVQIGGKYGKIEHTKKYKRFGQTMKQALIEDWKHSQSRDVRHLEFKLGLEVSTCTNNARRVSLIELFGTQTMLNHLRNSSLRWQSKDSKERFYCAVQDSDHTAFGRLYNQSDLAWQTDFSNAIGYCLDALKDTGANESHLELFWAPDENPGRKVTLRSSELSWIGFLAETTSSGTLAVLEDRCLEFPFPDIGKKCQNAHLDPRRVGSSRSTSGRDLNGSILETSVQLNQLCVPASIRDGHIRSVSVDGELPRHDYRWILSSVKEGDTFGFGEKGSLEAITPLNQGQILAKWSKPLGIFQAAKVLGGSQTPREHYECMREEDEQTSPVQFFVISNAPSKLFSGRPSRRVPSQASSSSVGSGVREYSYDSSIDGQPRTGPTQPAVSSQDRRKTLREILDRWKVSNSSGKGNVSSSGD